MDNSEIIKRYEQAKATRSVVEEMWDATARYIAPYRGRFFDKSAQEGGIEWRHRHVFDSTAVMAAKTLASHIHGSLTSPALQWFTLEYRDKTLRKDKDAQAWLESCSASVYSALQESNFNLEASEAYLDMVLFGTAAIVHEETQANDGWGGFTFSSVPVKEVYFDPDHKGNVYAFYRLLRWKPSAIIAKFGVDNVPASITDAYDRDPDTALDVVFAIYPRNNNAAAREVMAPKARPYGYKYVLRQGAELIGDEGGYYEMPAFLPRWSKTSESQWGNSPAMVALPDVLTLNWLVKMTLDSCDKVIDPPQKMNEGAVIGELNNKARGLTVMRDINEIGPLNVPIRFDVADMKTADLRQAIKSYFHVTDLELKESPAMTATEVRVRYEQMQKFLAPTLGRLESDFLNPLIERAFNMMLRAGELGPVPEVVRRSNSQWDVKYTGPLAMAQRSDRAVAIQSWVGNLAGMAEVLPEMLDVIDSVKIARELGTLLGVPASVMRSDVEVREMRAQREEAQQRMMEAEMQAAEGQAAEAQAKGVANMRAVGG